uniref:Uncharacterized protein n=1 Tax=Anguilla anguilla TaxID=7936 RepID=A0A0E9VA67_ANGAN
MAKENRRRKKQKFGKTNPMAH